MLAKIASFAVETLAKLAYKSKRGLHFFVVILRKKSFDEENHLRERKSFVMRNFKFSFFFSYHHLLSPLFSRLHHHIPSRLVFYILTQHGLKCYCALEPFTELYLTRVDRHSPLFSFIQMILSFCLT